MATSLQTLGAAFNPRHNSLNALRLALATLVIVSHSWPVGGYGRDPQIGDQNLGQWAVAGFFVISGYLITGSRVGSTLGAYLWRRLLRIYPAFLVILLLVSLVAAPLSVVVSGAGEYSVDAGIRYIIHNLGLFVIQYDIPGTLTSAPYPDSWNGPLWTLGYEFACYVLVGVLLTVLPRRRLLFAVAFMFVAGTAGTVAVMMLTPGDDGFVVRMLRLATYFLAGALIYLLRDRIVYSHWLGASSVIALALTAATSTFQAFAGLPLAYLMMYLGVALPFASVGRRNDISYGMYIYAFPVQQFIALTIGPSLSVWLFALVAVVTTVPFAWASWLLVERPAMTLRRAFETNRRSPTLIKTQSAL